MMDISAFPQVSDIFFAGISVHGTGFQSDLWLGNLAVVAFVVWCFRSGGKKALALALIPAALLAMGDATAAPFPSYGIESPAAYPIRRMPFDGMGITPIVIFGVLLWVVSGGKAEKSKAKKPTAKKPEDNAAALLALLSQGKKIIPFAALLAVPVIAHAGFFGNLLESDGMEAIRKAEAERIVAESRMDERAHRVLIQQAQAPKSQTIVHQSGVPWPVALGSTVAAVVVLGFFLIREERFRMAAESERERYELFYDRCRALLDRDYGTAEVDQILLAEKEDGTWTLPS